MVKPQRVTKTAQTTLDAAGGGRVDISPPGADWVVVRATVSTSSSTKQPTADLYRDQAVQACRIDGTYTGAKDTVSGLGTYTAGSTLICIWTGGDVGALATLRLDVIQYAPGTGPPDGGGFAPFSNSVVGGTTLVRDAINSPNYVAGVSGWSIMRTGAAEFSDATIRGSIRVNGTSNSWASLKTVAGVPELVFHPGDVGAHVFTEGVLLALATNPDGTPSTQIFSPTVDGLQDAKLFIIGKDGVGGVPQAYFQVDQFKVMPPNTFTDGVITTPADNSVRPYISSASEDWHTINPGNGWGNAVGFAACKYRLISSPAKTVEVQGNIFGGTTTAGTTIFTLPAGYRPTNKQRRPMGGSPTAGVPLLDIDSAGNCNLVNSWAGVVTVGFDLLISLDA